MRIVFAGTPGFAIPIIETLAQDTQEHSLVAVYTQPDRLAGRGRKIKASAVKQWASTHEYPLEQPVQWNDETIARLQQYNPDLLIVAAYGTVLPQSAIDLPKLASVNVHTSLLPRWRGAAPVARAIQHGDSITGVSLMRMRLSLDAGEIIQQNECSIADTDTAAALQQKLTTLACTMLKDFLADAAEKIARAQPQPGAGICYAHKLSKREALIDWHQSAQQIARQVRAFNPVPVACTHYRSKRLLVWNAATLAASPGGGRVPGEVISVQPEGIVVCCGQGAVALTEVQLAGRKILPAVVFAQGYDLAGTVLGETMAVSA